MLNQHRPGSHRKAPKGPLKTSGITLQRVWEEEKEGRGAFGILQKSIVVWFRLLEPVAKAALRALHVLSEVCGVNIVNTYLKSLWLGLSPPCTQSLYPKPPVHLTGFSDNGDCLHPEKKQPAFQIVLGIKRTLEGGDQVQRNHTKENPSHASDWADQAPSGMRMRSTLLTFCKGMFCRLWWAPERILCGVKEQEGRERMFILLDSDTHRRWSKFCGSCQANEICMFSVDHLFPLRIKKTFLLTPSIWRTFQLLISIFLHFFPS